VIFSISKLARYLEELPGVGPRQAKRFVYFLLNKDENFLTELSRQIAALKKEVISCELCKMFFENDGKNKQCKICRENTREKSKLLVIEKDVDLEIIERAGFYKGVYFVLGGLVPYLGKKMPPEIKMRSLFERVKQDASDRKLKEIILAFSANLEGDATSRYIEKILEPIRKKFGLKITRLGRGLSTGTELEYSDKDTIVNALKNRG
jgi:recombination protein RecR